MAYTGPLGGQGDEPFWSPEPLVGWRMWNLHGNRLVGRFGQWWASPVTEAVHAGSGNVIHEAPALNCRCGVNAYDTWARLIHRESYGHETVIGKVQMWGRIIEHEMGYRAQHARITRMWVVVDYSMIDLDYEDGLVTPGDFNTVRPLELTAAGRLARTVATLREVFLPDIGVVPLAQLDEWRYGNPPNDEED